MNYTVKLTDKAATIEALPSIYLHFAHLDFALSQDYEQRIIRGVNRYFGGMGEGLEFDNWQDAIHSSLYDAFQVHDELHDSDTFTVKYNGEICEFACEGVHVLNMEKA